MAEQQKQPAVFCKVSDLRPLATGLNLTVKVTDAKVIKQRGNPSRQTRISECLVGDETSIIVFTARNDQVELMKEGNTVILRNAKIEMYKGSMRLAVDKWGLIEVTEPATFTVRDECNLSLIEFERIDVVV